jgi:hypothetical protein
MTLHEYYRRNMYTYSDGNAFDLVVRNVVDDIQITKSVEG